MKLKSFIRNLFRTNSLRNQNTELKPTQKYVEETPHNKENSGQLRVSEKIPNSEMTIVGNETIGYRITMGNYALTAPLNTYEECVELAANRDWNLIMAVIWACTDAINKQKTIDDTIQNKKEVKQENDFSDKNYR